MKFRIAFAISKRDRKVRLRFWKWDIWRLDNSKDKIEEVNYPKAEPVKENSSKSGFLSFKKTEGGEKSESGGVENSEGEAKVSKPSKLFLQALFYPDVESRIMRVGKRLGSWAINIFTISFPQLEIRGSFGDPFYDGIAFGMSQGAYIPDWENENADWSVKGEALLKSGFFHLIFFVLGVLYEFASLTFILWRGARLAKKNPNGENLSGIRRWVFLKVREMV
ncbi:hypothetical protein AGMMS49938_12850 [Fibrobacterales bacterium]|nr:hypothetical protein AGMMS49938_12850 [Fibrobacterales bacterium]